MNHRLIDRVRRLDGWTMFALVVLLIVGLVIGLTVAWLVDTVRELADEDEESDRARVVLTRGIDDLVADYEALAGLVEALGGPPIPPPSVPSTTIVDDTLVIEGPPGPAGLPGADGQDGARGRPGDPGPGPSDEQVAEAVLDFCAAHADCRGAPGTDGQTVVGPAGPEGASIVGPQGPPGETVVGPPGPGPTAEQIAQAVADYCAARAECRGEQGPPGPPGSSPTTFSCEPGGGGVFICVAIG